MPYSRRDYVPKRFGGRSRYLGGVVQRRRKAVAASRYKLARPVRTLVDRRIDRKIETKSILLKYRRTQWRNAPDAGQRCIQVFPSIDQGDTRDAREGSKITLTSGWVKGMITIPSYDSSTSSDRSSISFRLCMLSCKAARAFPDVQGNWPGPGNLYTQLLKGDSSASPAIGVLQDTWEPINTDMFTVHYDKTFVMNRGQLLNPGAGGVGTAHMPAVSRSFYIKVKCKNKLVRYSDFGQVEPTNFAPFIVGWWAYTDGAAPSAAAVPFVEFQSMFHFKDA